MDVAVGVRTEDSISVSNFWKAICLLINNFSAVKKSSHLKILRYFEVEGDLDQETAFSDVNDFLQYIRQRDNFTELNEINISEINPIEDKYRKLLLLVRVLKKRPVHAEHAALLLDFINRDFTFTYIDNGPHLNFVVRFGGNRIIAELSSTSDEREQNWCKFVLEKKLTNWATNIEIVGRKIQSLSLIDIENYNLLYQLLKEKYGESLKKVWPECTDPIKFIYEDIAIAAYLILLWKQLGKPKGFVDLGCGNGLLVYILNSEGFNGYGVDIRRRKIWDIYPPFVSLIEEVIVPSDLRRYENIDWIIGNHSDELSAWIPIIAALNSYDTYFFLLPCCAYELNGDKYQRRDCKRSVYNDFLQYIEEISTDCGFITKVDRLKIPSTKRIAYLGIKRNYTESQFKSEEDRIKSMVKSAMDKTKLKLRERSQVVRNCTQIEKTVLEKIILKICTYLLMVEQDQQQNNHTWRKGRIVSIRAIADCLPSDDLKSIKSEHGGLKTLFKNKHEIFEVNGDKVGLRYPVKRKENKNINHVVFKKRDCFFYNNHPDGCPLANEDCTFIHRKI